MKPKNENAKDPHHIVPVDLPGVKPEDYTLETDSGGGAVAPSERDTKDGTLGFSPQLAGHGKADVSGTSSFDAGPPKYTAPGFPSSKETASTQSGQEEGGRKRQPSTSAVARVTKE